MRAIRLTAFAAIFFAVAGCTPDHALKTGEDIAAQARITDSVVIRRSNDRLLSRQAHICLVSDQVSSPAGLALLQNMQASMSGYFLSVGVESQPLGYSANMQAPCPGANYVFYVQPLDAPCKSGSPSCNAGRISDVLITVLNGDNSGVADRITLTLQRSWLSLAVDAQSNQREAFEQLARNLTGINAP